MSEEFKAKVTEAIKGATQGEDGKTVFPEGTDSAVAYAAGLESRRRHTQSELAKEQQKGQHLEVENNKMASLWAEDVSKNLTSAQATELEELKHTDPEAWREKLNTYETDNATAFNERRAKVKTDAQNETELERRTRVIKEYNEANPSAQLTDDVIQNDLPPRLTQQFSSGEITFDEFLTKSATFLGKDKVIAPGEQAPDGPDLSNLGGGGKPSEAATAADIEASYKGEIY